MRDLQTGEKRPGTGNQKKRIDKTGQYIMSNGLHTWGTVPSN